jgi:3-oxoacyl-[acyl-carrier protein] reductase
VATTRTERFRDKVAIVTGAARGIGRRTALDLAAEGAKVVATDIVADELEDLGDEIGVSGGTCLAHRCDISDRRAVDGLVDAACREYGSVHILINNAGFLIAGTIEETSDELIERTIDVNLKGVLYAIRAVAPVMKMNGYGRIVNVASITGKSGDNSTIFAYGASKGAVISLTRSVARELGPAGITCNSIAPHAVMTPMMEYWDQAKREAIAAMIPVRRLGTVEDMSSLLRFLASDESSFINGETVNINGGFYMD